MKNIPDQAILTIGALAKHTGTQVETIRYYEQEGLLPAPSRSPTNYRLYTSTHVERLQFIRHCRSLDMTLAEIRSLLRFRDAPEENCSAVNVILETHIQHVTQRIAVLQALAQQLEELRNLCKTSQASSDCAILQRLGKEGDNALKNLGGHKGGCH